MSKTIEIWEQSGLLEGLTETQAVECSNRMESMKRFLLSPGYSSLRIDDLTVNPEMVIFPIVRRMVVKGVQVDALTLMKDFIEFCKENQSKDKYLDADDSELDLTFDFCKEYAE